MKKNVLYLYAEFMEYNLSTVKQLINKGYSADIFHWDNQKETPYIIPNLDNLTLYGRSNASLKNILKVVDEKRPELVIVSGWQDKLYVIACLLLRLKGYKVVVCFDDQWHGTIKQNFAKILGLFGFFKLFFSHAWISGPYQYEYARYLNFNKGEIINDFLAPDCTFFYEAFSKRSSCPKNFLYVGRLEDVKGLKILLESWRKFISKNDKWTLTIIGSGSIKIEEYNLERVIHKDFMDTKSLAEQSLEASCLILPSRSEQWGVVVHEFSSAGLALILSDAVGSAPVFLTEGMNGYKFKKNNADLLLEKMLKITELEDADLKKMSKFSNMRSKKITPESSAYNLISICE